MKPKEQPLVIGTGLVALDRIVPNSVKPEFILRAGGSCGNVMAIAASTGWHAKPAARLDTTHNTDIVRADLAACGVDTSLVQASPSGSTPVILQLNESPGTKAARHTFHWRCPECSEWFPRFKPLLLTQVDHVVQEGKGAKAFYFDRASPAALKLAEHFRDQGAVVFFEPNSIREEKQFKRAVALSHIVKYSQERLGSQTDLLQKVDVLLQVETLGAAGLRFTLHGSKWEALPSHGAPLVIDSAGAGDWLSAAIITRLCAAGAKGLTNVSRQKVGAALAFGQALAALNCGFAGARGLMDGMNPDEAFALADAIATGKRPRQASSATTAKKAAPEPAEVCPACRGEPMSVNEKKMATPKAHVTSRSR